MTLSSRIVKLYMKTAAPIKKGSNLYKLEGQKIKTWVVISVGSKNTKIIPGKTIPPEGPSKMKWAEETVVPAETPGRFRTSYDRGSDTTFYSDLDDARERLFRTSLKDLQTKISRDWALEGLKIDTIKRIADDYGFPIDEGLLKVNPE